MNRYRVLLYGSREILPDDLPPRLHQDSGQELVAEAVTAVTEALSRLGEKGYDAAVCWADRTDELAAVIRIRKANPDLPILVMTSQDHAGFEDLSAQAGATRTARVGRDAASCSERILQYVQSGELRRAMLQQVRQVRAQSRDLHALTKTNRELVQTALTQVRRKMLPRVPLLVEDDPGQAWLLSAAFEKAGIRLSVPIQRSGEEAIALLSSEATYEPLDPIQPFSFVLLDVELPGMSGLDVLGWMVRNARLRHVPVVMLSSSTEPANVHRAFELGAKSYLIKPSGFDALVRLVEGVHRFWSIPDPSAAAWTRSGPPLRP